MHRWQDSPQDKEARKTRSEPTERRNYFADRLAGKSAKEDVEYRPAHHGTKSMCSECEHFLFPGNESSSCRRVAGVVYAEDTCDLFVPRVAEYGEQGQGVTQIHVEVHSNTHKDNK